DPMVGRRIMQVHLIDPYLERLAESDSKAAAGETEAAAGDGAPAAAESGVAHEAAREDAGSTAVAEAPADPDPNALIDSLFD
ncbi:MAG: hypothetical protein O7D96_11610, partial [SAR324 cluster bacterium]|nr:hypothetical protein [SAR324 cluster bacterium]